MAKKREDGVVKEEVRTQKIIACVRDVFPDANDAHVDVLIGRVRKIIGKYALDKIRRRGSDIEIWLTDGTEFIANGDLTSYMRESTMHGTVGRNATGHYLPASSIHDR